MLLDEFQTNGWLGRPLWAEIDLDALAFNVASLKSQARPAAMAAVVKANAYGHGAVGAARAALEAGADRLAQAILALLSNPRRRRALADRARRFAHQERFCASTMTTAFEGLFELLT